MKPRYLTILLLLLVSALPVGYATAQQAAEPEEVTAANGLLHSRIVDLDHYANRVRCQQDRLLRRLARKEARLLRRLRHTDSVAATRLAASPASFDSLRRRSRDGLIKGRGRADAAVDSLCRIASFTQRNFAPPGATLSTGIPGTEKLGSLDDALSVRSELSSQISARLQTLKGSAKSMPGIMGLEKQVFYTGSRIKAWRQVADNPSKLEAKALETLQGTEGFSEAFSTAVASGRSASVLDAGNGSAVPTGSASAADLEKLGFQTKRQLQTSLQQQFGPNLSTVQRQLGGQVADYQKTLKEVKGGMRDVRSASDALRGASKPSFRINPMRGLPFVQRLEKGYVFQGTRASGSHPARLDISGQLAFRHTPSLSHGLATTASVGLGQDWNSIQLSLQAVGGRAFSQWTGKYGFGAYAEYELIRNLDPALNQEPPGHLAEIQKGFHLGLFKYYQFSGRLKGSLQLLFNPAWREENRQSPIIFRTVITQ
jgi:hypothetical protein